MTLGDLNFINHIDFVALRGGKKKARQKERNKERKEEKLALYFPALGKQKLYEVRKERRETQGRFLTEAGTYILRVSNECHLSVR